MYIENRAKGTMIVDIAMRATWAPFGSKIHEIILKTSNNYKIVYHFYKKKSRFTTI